MNNSFSNSSASVMSAKSSSVLSSSKSAASTARSSESSHSAAKASAKVTPREVLPLKKRTSVEQLHNGDVEKLDITEKTGDEIEVYLVAPSYKEAEEIDDARQVMEVSQGHTFMRLTTPDYQEKLFSIMENLSINGQPSKMKWEFANKHIEAFNWIISKANSFLANKFNAA